MCTHNLCFGQNKRNSKTVLLKISIFTTLKNLYITRVCIRNDYSILVHMAQMGLFQGCRFFIGRSLSVFSAISFTIKNKKKLFSKTVNGILWTMS